jgi:hypothetical protein
MQILATVALLTVFVVSALVFLTKMHDACYRWGIAITTRRELSFLIPTLLGLLAMTGLVAWVGATFIGGF